MGNNSSKEPEGVPSKAQQHIWVPDSEHLQAEQPGLDRSPSSTSGEAASFSNLSVPQHPSDNWRSRSPSAAATPTDLPPAYSNDYRACEQYATPLPGQSSRRYASGYTSSRKDVESATQPQGLVRKGSSDGLQELRRYDTIILVDDSRSMGCVDHPPKTRWEEAEAALVWIAEKASKFDADGIDIHFLNACDPQTELAGKNMTKPEDVRALFRSVKRTSGTPIGTRLETLLRAYMEKLDAARLVSREALKAVKPINIIVITDGEPSDDPESMIVYYARTLEKQNSSMTQVGIQFVQIGNDAGATRFLHDLDDNLVHLHKIWDIVDTTPYTGNVLTPADLTKILLGGINRKKDKLPNGQRNTEC